MPSCFGVVVTWSIHILQKGPRREIARGPGLQRDREKKTAPLLAEKMTVKVCPILGKGTSKAAEIRPIGETNSSDGEQVERHCGSHDNLKLGLHRNRRGID
jgi:hypothetical protein